jgi:prolyl-tRNA synthetase
MQPVVMGSYGIGPARVMATVVELFHDAQGIIWPKSIAPFDVHVVELNPKLESGIMNETNELVSVLEKQGMSVLHDDRAATAGQKFADSDLIGIPVRVVVSGNTIIKRKVEYKGRRETTAKFVTKKELLEELG